MASSPLKDAAVAQGLTEQTLDILQKEDINSVSVLGKLTDEDITNLGLTIGQRRLLLEWRDTLTGSNQTATVSTVSGNTIAQEPTPSHPEQTTETTPSHPEQDGKTREPTTQETTNMAPSSAVTSEKGRKLIGVSGLTWAGKSSLVNALGGLTAEGKTARIGLKSGDPTTNTYDIPNTPISLVDLPGVDTVHNMNEYMSLLDTHHLDGLIICTSERLHELSVDLAVRYYTTGKPCFFVRTKMDSAVEGDLDDYGDQHNESQLLDRIRHEIQEQLRDEGLQYGVYLVGSRAKCRDKWDMQKLRADIVKLQPRPYTQVFVASFPTAPAKAADSEYAAQFNIKKKSTTSFRSGPSDAENREALKQTINSKIDQRPDIVTASRDNFLDDNITKTAEACKSKDNITQMLRAVDDTLKGFDHHFGKQTRKHDLGELKTALDKIDREYTDKLDQLKENTTYTRRNTPIINADYNQKKAQLKLTRDTDVGSRIVSILAKALSELRLNSPK